MTNERRFGIGIGAVFMAIGLGVYLAVNTDPSGARAPIFVVEAAAGCFFFAGVSMTARAFGADLAARLCGLAVVYLLAVPGLWMLFDGDGQCSVRTLIGGSTWRGEGDPGLCRLVFGGGGLVVIAFAVAMTAATLWRRDPDKPNPTA